MRILIAASLLGATMLGGIAYAAQTPPASPPAASATGPAESVTRAQFIDHAGKAFDRLDANKDGLLTRDERKMGRHHGPRGGMGGMAFARPQDGGPRPGRGMGKGMGMGRGGTPGMIADADGDGRITRAEYSAQWAKMFARMDANGDGVLDANEMGRMGRRLDADGDGKVTRAEFDKQAADRFARMDANGDGVIDASERPGPRGGGAMPAPAPTAKP